MIPRVAVSIVNWNTRDALERCLGALLADDTWHGDIVVVDNASSDDSAGMVRRRFPRVTLIANERNEGFAAGNNRALPLLPADYVLILNPDVEVAPGAIAQLVNFMERTPSAAAAAPALVGDDGRLQAHLYGRFPSIAQVLLSWTVLGSATHRIGALRRRISEHDIRGTEPVSVDQVPGAAMLIRARVLAAVGPLDPGYFIWFEDVDWCYRARRAGYDIFVVPACRVRHEGGASFGRWTVQTRAFQFYRAFFRFLCRHRLNRLIRVALPVLTADLWLKGAIIRVRRALGLPFPGDVRTLAPTRRAIAEVVRSYRSGTIVDFTSADIPVIDAARAPEPAPPRFGPDASIDVVIVNWNGRQYLPQCISALLESTVPFHLILVDNASTDGSVDYLRTCGDRVHVIALRDNVGYAAGANVGIHAGRAQYVMVMNPDVRVAADHLAILRDCLETDSGIGVAQGKLYQISRDEFVAGRTPAEPRLDSAGHEIRRSRMVVDRGQERPDSPEFSRPASVFSGCGAALFLRRATLEDIATAGEYFSEAFFAYKEDIDIGWRARLMGWDVRYVPDAIAHHVRSLPLEGSAWRSMPLAARRHSWKNHYLLMIRNDRISDIVRDLPFVAAWEVARLGHAILRDPRVLLAYMDLIREIRPALHARREIQRRRRVTGRDIRRWFGTDAIPVSTRLVAERIPGVVQ